MCDYELDSNLSRIVGYPPISGAFRFQISDGLIVDLVHEFPFEEFSPNVWEPFVSWFDTTHPGEFLTVFRIMEDGGTTPILTQEALELHRAVIAEYEASRN